MSNFLTRLVTPAFITVMAHMWFAYAVVFTFFSWWTVASAVVIAGVKEFYIDKHYEVSQSFIDNLEDWCGYLVGIALAVFARRVVGL